MAVGLGGAAAQVALRSAADPAAVSHLFTYQGQLSGPGGPVDAVCDMDFRLYDTANAGGTSLARP